MLALLDTISTWFLTQGIHPTLGAFVLGTLFGFILGYWRKRETGKTTKPAAGAPETKVMGQSSRLMITINGAQVEVPAEILEHLRNGNKLSAVKILRTSYGISLSEAKQMVDALGEIGQ